MKISPIELATLIYGSLDKTKDIDFKEAKIRNEVADNFMRFFKIKIKDGKSKEDNSNN